MKKTMLILLLFFSNYALAAPKTQFSFSEKIIEELGNKIWYNESAHQPHRLDLMTFWNEREPFPSLGIAHFIWPSKSYQGPFASGRFHHVIRFLYQHGAHVPNWLLNQRHCPWETREEFYHAIDSKKMKELQQLLFETKSIQALYLIERLKDFYADLLKNREAKALHVFEKVLATANGPYILVDYLNFKHEGTNPKERYQGEGWGLLQVLNHAKLSDAPEKAFAESAKQCLIRRVNNAPDPEKESFWLPNWFERLDSYCD